VSTTLLLLVGGAAGAAVGVAAGWILRVRLSGPPRLPPAPPLNLPDDLLPSESAAYFTADLAVESRFEELASFLVHTAASRVRMPIALVMREALGGRAFIEAVSATLDSRLRGFEVDIDGTAGRVITDGVALVGRDDERVVAIAPGERRRGPDGGLAVPLAQGGQVFGALVAFGRSPADAGDTVNALADLGRRFGPALLPSYMAKVEGERALTDDLTALPNRRALNRAVSIRTFEQVALIVMDLDLFKRINDGFGHQAGDAALRHVARTLKEAVRRREGDLVARIGGEEFAVWLPGASLESGMEVAERVRQQVENRPFPWHGERMTLTISCGVAAYPKPTPAVENLMPVADEALYEAKRAGRNKVVAGTRRSG
jgi:diguanylate cyclase (GGDEF)-like protein